MTVAAVMTLYDRQLFALDDPVSQYLPEFAGKGRERVTMRQLLTHCSGLPDQLPENARLRASHAPLSEFVLGALRTPLLFQPGTQYSYSSMGILLAGEVAQRLSGQSIADLVEDSVLRPLKMRHSALGLGTFELDSLVRCQVKDAAAESGSGDASATDWDWNSPYWRKLGAPWGGAHGSAGDVARFLASFLYPQGEVLRPETARLMIRNHNPVGLRPRGLGFDLGPGLSGPARADVFGHGGATGTLCWADPVSETICVVLTTLPSTAAHPHPRLTASQLVARSLPQP
jgi:CubicO group peptidase (beta-lactamase class C family)